MRTFAAVACAILLLGSGACDLNDPDEIQNQANLALVRVQFFASSTSRTPVPGVRMIVEAPQQQQGGGGQTQRRYEGPDVVAISGEDGMAEAFVFPGYQSQSGGTGGGTGGDPTNPFDLPPALIFADVRVVFLYQGAVIPYLEGLTINSGRLFDLGAVYLDEFGVVVD
jgi:hypothetical protein